MNLDSEAGNATRSYAGDCICVSDLEEASGGFRAFCSHLKFAGSSNRHTRQPCVGLTQFCMYLQQVWRRDSGGIFQLRSNEFYILGCEL